MQKNSGETGTDELGEYIEQIERHLDWMHRRAEWRQDPDTVAAVEAIQKKLVVAKEHRRTLCRLCAEELHDTVMARECCQTIDDAMHEVIEDHLALIRRLRSRRPGHPRARPRTGPGIDGDARRGERDGGFDFRLGCAVRSVAGMAGPVTRTSAREIAEHHMP